jgi:hypothetical protein
MLHCAGYKRRNPMNIQPTQFKASKSRKRFPVVSLRHEQWERIVYAASLGMLNMADSPHRLITEEALGQLEEELKVGK